MKFFEFNKISTWKSLGKVQENFLGKNPFPRYRIPRPRLQVSREFAHSHATTDRSTSACRST